MKNKEIIDKNTVLAFNSWQRWFHIHIIHFMVLFILTGLPILAPNSFAFLGHFYEWIYGLITGKETSYADGILFAQMLHRGASIFFIITIIPFSIVMLMNIKDWRTFPEKDGSIKEGLKQLHVSYIRCENPKFGKYNMAQKAMSWFMIVAVFLLVVSGLMLMMGKAIVFARLVHVVTFAAIVIMLIMHMHFALLPKNRKALYAMFRDGKLPMDDVKHHHPLWYEQLQEQKSNNE